MIIAVGNMKGGVGSSTLATQLAVAFQREGASVVLIDTDQSQTASTWCARRQVRGLEPVPVEVASRGIGIALDRLCGYDVRLVDVARYLDEIQALAARVDFWFAPTRVSTDDLDATIRTCDAVRSARPRCLPVPIRFAALLNQTSTAPRSRAEAHACAYLTGCMPEMNVLRQALRARCVWQEVFVGDSLLELPVRTAGEALVEFTGVFEEIKELVRFPDSVSSL